MKRYILTMILGYLSYLIFTTSCANQGMPTGGDKDSIAPVVLKTVPLAGARNYKGSTVNLTFDEFIVSTDVSSNLVVSPPLKKQPIVRTKSKTLIVDFGEQLKPNKTYSLDFKSSIVDNNEKNPLVDYRFAFSNGPEFDSLMVGGYVRMAENMEPVEEVLVLLHSVDSLHYFRDSIPDYIAKTDDEGFYLISNVAPGNYRLYAVQDADNSLTFNQTSELIAFYDSLVVPAAPIVADSIPGGHKASDRNGPGREHEHDHSQYNTKPYYLLLYEEESYNQYLEDSKRDRADLCQFFFDESVTDSFRVELVKPKLATDWALLEFSTKRDSVNLWIKDTTLSQQDTLIFQVNYEVQDSLENLVLRTDTVSLVYTKPTEKEKKKKKEQEEEEAPKVQHFSFRANGKEGFDGYRKLVLEAPEPLDSFDFGMVHLYQKVDTLEEEREFTIARDSVSLRKYIISYPWEFQEEYRLEVDSAAATTIRGYPSNKFGQKLTIKEEAYYAKIILTVSNLHGQSFIQVVKNTDDEEVISQIGIDSDGEIEFPFLNPDKFKIRLVIDSNKNGKWDIGRIDEGLQPERVIYYPKILKLRSNFEIRENWILPDDLQFKKELIDEDQLEKDKKTSKGGSAKNQQGRPGGSR
ncbi:Ig-like domain-containing domain [Mangrovibacterium sp.]|uniref:Ig-like domain-containing domain n=1 Tax=Mangrovibacterium sp. TaxID=1961364 RepID=UPI0035614361